MDAEPPRCTWQDAKSQEVLDRRAAVRRDRNAAGAQRVGERTCAVADERRFLARLGEVHGDGEPLAARQLGGSPVQRLTHGIWRMRRDAQADLVRNEGPEALDGSRELRQAGGTLRR